MSAASTSAEANAVEAKNLDLVFQTRDSPIHALSEVNLEIRRGDFISFIGPSGCGKTTLLRVIADLEKPTGGSIVVNGVSPEQARLQRAYGYVFQSPALFPWRTVEGNLKLPLEIMGIDAAERTRRAKESLKIVPNASKLKQTPASEETDGKTGKSGKAKGGWLANQVKKAGLDKQAAPEEEIQEDELATATASILAGVSGIRAEKINAEQRAEISKRLFDAELAKEKTKQWRDMQEIRSKLPARDLKDVVLQAIEDSNATVVSGATGCGKTTQVPQFIFEEAVRAGKGGETSISKQFE